MRDFDWKSRELSEDLEVLESECKCLDSYYYKYMSLNTEVKQ